MHLAETLPLINSKPRSAVYPRLLSLQPPESTRGDATTKIWHNMQIPTNAPTRNKFQRFTNDPPCSSFKKLVVSTPRLLRDLHTMSLAKAVSDGLKDCECKKIAICKYPPIPYVPKKDCAQDLVLSFKDNHCIDTDRQRYGTLSFYLALRDSQSISHSHGICNRGN